MEYYCERLPNVKRLALRCAAWGDVFTRVHFVDAHFVRLPTCSNEKLHQVRKLLPNLCVIEQKLSLDKFTRISMGHHR